MHTVEVTFSNPRSKPEETPGIPLLDRQLSKEDPGISPKDPSKAISGANTSFLDITKQFVSAAEGWWEPGFPEFFPNFAPAIGLGKFIKEDGFSLFDAVGALEVIRTPLHIPQLVSKPILRSEIRKWTVAFSSLTKILNTIIPYQMSLVPTMSSG